jgi:hypothetical protein
MNHTGWHRLVSCCTHNVKRWPKRECQPYRRRMAGGVLKRCSFRRCRRWTPRALASPPGGGARGSRSHPRRWTCCSFRFPALVVVEAGGCWEGGEGRWGEGERCERSFPVECVVTLVVVWQVCYCYAKVESKSHVCCCEGWGSLCWSRRRFARHNHREERRGVECECPIIHKPLTPRALASRRTPIEKSKPNLE